MYNLNSEKVLFTQLVNQGIMFQVETNEYFTTNETLTLIMLGLQNQLNREQIIQNFLEKFEIDEATCNEKVDIALKLLQEKGFID
jgi:hypothetical protein